MAEDPAKN